MFTFTLTPDGGQPFRITADSRDVLMWERTTKGANLITLRDSLSMQAMYRIAHIACWHQGLIASGAVSAELREFEASHTIELVDDEDDEPDPTRPAP